MNEARAFHLSTSLRVLLWIFLALWLLLAIFPLLWIWVMSFKLPIDAFSADPRTVIIGSTTREAVGGLSVLGMLIVGALLVGAFLVQQRRHLPTILWIALFILAAIMLPSALRVVDNIFSALLPTLTKPLVGFTGQHYHAVWVENTFYHQFINSIMITAGVVCFSLVLGTTAGYALARTRSSVAFWLLAAALIFRALPHSVLVSGYLQPFIDYGLYGKHIAVIIVLAAINQPFTIWMLRSFFASIPAELDEAALVDGCTRLEAFWRVIMPVMWPGVITTGLFSFLLAYNDYLVTSLLLDAHSMTMVPSITQYFNRETTMTDQVEAIAAAISITAPLFVLVMLFQKQIVSGLVQGAVKG
ncbi:MAG: carbohydrate ABC transporter permease [Gammaproteobacteria bacterium]